jgi:uncharacterized protein involved in outer membrane biogenesis
VLLLGKLLRDLLTGLAIILLVCLTGGLVAPHFINWESHRAEISSRLSDMLGVPVQVSGAISIELLPTPTLKLSQVTFGGSGSVSGEVGRLKVKAAIPPLLRGELHFTEATLQSAQIVVRAAQTVSNPEKAPPIDTVLPAVRFEKLLISGSKLTVMDSDGGISLLAENVEGQVEATSLTGPFRGNLGFDAHGDKRSLRFSTGRNSPSGLRVKALMENELAAARTEYDGLFLVSDGQFTADGAIAASGNAAIAGLDGYGNLIWRLAAKVKGAGPRASFEQLEVTLGNADRQAVLTGNGDIDLTRKTTGRVTLSARQIDLDRLLASEGSTSSGSPESLVRAFLNKPTSSVNVPWLSGELDLSIGSLMVGADAVVAPRLIVSTQDGRVFLKQFSGEFPGKSSVTLTGQTVAETLDGFNRISIESRDIAKLSGWFHAIPPRPLGVRVFKVDGDLKQDPTGFSITNATVTADDMRLGGSLSVQNLSERPKLTLNLNADQLDVAKLPEWIESDKPTALDFDVNIDARRVRYAGVGAGSIQLRLRRAGEAVTLDDLKITDLGGANLSAKGVLTTGRQKLEVQLDAQKLEALLELADRLSSHTVLPHLVRRAAHLSPAKMTLSIEPDLKQPDQRLMAIKGILNETEINGSILLNNEGHITGANTFAMDIKSSKPATVFQQIGLNAVHVQGASPVNLKMRGGGLSPQVSTVDWSLLGEIAGVKVDLVGQQTRDVQQPLAGRIMLNARDISPFAHSLLIAVPAVSPGQDMTLTAGIDLRGYRITLREMDMKSGDATVRGEIAFNLAEFGRVSGQLKTGPLDAAAFGPLIFGALQQSVAVLPWSKDRFMPPAAITLPGDLWIEAERVDVAGGLSFQKPTFVLRFENGLIYLEHAEADWSGGKLKAQATLRRSNQSVSLSGRFGVEGMELDRMPVSQAPSTQALKGTATALVDFSAVGESPASMISALAGTGKLDIKQVEVAGLNAGALHAIVNAPEKDLAVTTPDKVAAAFREGLIGPLKIPTGSASLTLGSGVLRAGPIAVASAQEDISTSLALDFKDLTINGQAAFTARMQPKGWVGAPPRVTLMLRGPINNPQHEVEAGALANGMTALAIARETERIDVLEHDQRERAAFNRRLRASEDERRALDDEKKRLDTLRRAQDEQRRQEATRQERLNQERVNQETLRQRIDGAIRNAPATGNTPPASPLPAAPLPGAPLQILPQPGSR